MDAPCLKPSEMLVAAHLRKGRARARRRVELRGWAPGDGVGEVQLGWGLGRGEVLGVGEEGRAHELLASLSQQSFVAAEEEDELVEASLTCHEWDSGLAGDECQEEDVLVEASLTSRQLHQPAPAALSKTIA